MRALRSAIARRDCIEQESSLEHVVIEAELEAGQHVDPGIAQQSPMALAQLGRRIVQLRRRGFAATAALERVFQFTLALPRGTARLVTTVMFHVLIEW